jgi:hypothetical protein
MSVTQISVIARNEPGSMAKIAKALGDAGVIGIAMSTAELYEGGAARIIVDNPNKALDALEKKGFLLATTEVTVVEIDDAPGALARLLGELAVRQIDIAYMYVFPSRRAQDKAVMVFKTKVDGVSELLRELKVKELSLDDLRA